ncbi:MAG: hypothetical protein RR981_07905, partial [Oscillospiraceae bacterium]
VASERLESRKRSRESERKSLTREGRDDTIEKLHLREPARGNGREAAQKRRRNGEPERDLKRGHRSLKIKQYRMRMKTTQEIPDGRNSAMNGPYHEYFKRDLQR